MSLENEQEKWINWHLSRRNGERKDALKRGHGYGNRFFIEKIWWPLVGHFEGLHPEYEMLDWRGRSYDFIQAILRNMWAPYLNSGKPVLQPYEKIERMIIRYAACHNRIIRPQKRPSNLICTSKRSSSIAVNWCTRGSFDLFLPAIWVRFIHTSC